jgi:predicted N-formylglutamate amidohydrolase
MGLLYDPHRYGEKAFAQRLAQDLKQHNLRVRLNYPYRGTSDGLTTHCRRLFPPEQYVGLEIEVNQRHLQEKRGVQRMTASVAQSLRRVLARPGAGN